MTEADLSSKSASAATTAVNAEVLGRLPFADRTDFELAERGRLASAPRRQITSEGGGVTWDLDSWEFLNGDAPDTVNPSLWRQSQLCAVDGLFEVVDGIYQVRGFDLSNITFVRGDTGWIVVDPLTSAETALAAFDLVADELGERPVVAVIYTHSHVDHFAGVRGIVSDDDVAAGRVRIIAPAGFLEAAISENVIAGNVMTRRASYMYGVLLPRGPRGLVGSGLASAGAVKRAALLAFGVAALAGLGLAAVTSWWLLAVGAAALLAGWGYTGGPKPYGYMGLGELFVFTFFGLVATAGTTYVVCEHITAIAWLAGCAAGCLACALLVINNLRDIPTDREVGKRTLAVRLGDARTRWLYIGLLAATLVLWVVVGISGRPWAAIGVVGAVVAVPAVKAIRSGAKGAALIPVLGVTGKAQLVTGLLAAIGIAVSG